MVRDQWICRSLGFSRRLHVGLWIEALSNCGDLLAAKNAPFILLLDKNPRQMELLSWSLDR